MRKFHKVICFFFIIFAWFFFQEGINVKAKLVNRIVAVVNGEIITLQDLKQRLESNVFSQSKLRQLDKEDRKEFLEKQVLQFMINAILLRQEAERLSIKVSDTEVENQIEELKKKQNLSDEEFNELLKKNDLTLSEFKKRIREEIKRNRLLNSMVRQKVVVTEEEIRTYFDKHKDKYKVSKRLHLKLIILPNKKELLHLRQKILNGEISFAKAARKHSQGPGASKGGDLGIFKWKDLDLKWKNALKDLGAGEISKVFAINEQYALLFLESIKEEKSKTLTQVKDKIREQLYKQKFKEQYQEYIQKLRSEAILDIRI